MYKVRVNEDKEMSVDIAPNRIVLDGNPVAWDIAVLGNNHFHILMRGTSYRCEVMVSDAIKKMFLIKVNGKVIKVEVKDRFDELLHRLGMDKISTNKINAVKAPMPGMVLKLIVQEGQAIRAGDSLLILEAMKMENMIKSPGSGVVKRVMVQERDIVEKNQVMVEFK
jgi:acetyl/propionyl-CoA carboxylase alpha subunit